MKVLIDYAVELMEKQNTLTIDKPSENKILNPKFNKYIDTVKNQTLNINKNPLINKDKNIKWKEYQWDLFRQTPIYEYLTKEQKILCLKYLKSLK
jgi:hypothetical protein